MPQEVSSTTWRPVARVLAGWLLLAALVPAGVLLAQNTTFPTSGTWPAFDAHFVNPPTAPLTADTYFSAEVNRPAELVRAVTFTAGNSLGSADWPGEPVAVDGRLLYRFLLPVTSLPAGSYTVAVTALTETESDRETITVEVASAISGGGGTTTAGASDGAATPVPVTGAITQPDDGAVASGRLALEARVSRALEGLKFYLHTSGATAGGEVTAEGSDGGTTWRAELDTTAWPDGSYELVAVGWDNDGSYPVDRSALAIANASAVSTVTPLALAIVSPLPGQVSGAVRVAVVPSRPVEWVRIAVAGPSGTELAAAKDAYAGWVAIWETADWPAGGYRLVARARAADAEASSAPVDVWIEPTPGPVPATTANSSPASVAFTDVGPGGEISGTVQLFASTQPLVNALGFLIATADGQPVGAWPAAYADGRWAVAWASGQVADGDYRLTAVALLDGREARSEPVALRVRNAPAPVEPSAAPEPAAVPSPTSDSVTPPLLEPIPPAPAAEPIPNSDDGELLAPLPSSPPPPTSGLQPEPLPDTARLADPRWAWCVAADVGDDEACRRRLLAEYLGGGRELVCRLLGAPREGCLRQLPADALPAVCRGGGVTQAEACAQLLAEVRLPSRCVNAGINDPTRCRDELRDRYRGECTAADVADAACDEYLRQQITVAVRCPGRPDDACDQRTLRQQAVEILFAQRTGAKVEAVVAPLVGTSVVLDPARQPVRPLTSDAVTRLEELTPLRLGSPTPVAVLPMVGGVVVSGSEVVSLPSAGVAIDTDRDGLPDDAERLVGSDPGVADTDGDGYPDAQEVAAGYSPTGSGAAIAEPPVVALARGAAFEQPRRGHGAVDPALAVAEVANPTEPDGRGYRLRGRGPAGGVVTLFVYSSLPLVVVTEVDAYGNWTYALRESLADGHHAVYVTVNDDTGRLVGKSSPLDFFVREAKAVTAREYLGAQPSARTAAPTPAYLTLAAGVAAVGVGLFLLVVRQVRRSHATSL